MKEWIDAWKARRRLRRTLRWLEAHLLGGVWRLQGNVACLPAGADGEPDAYQRRMLPEASVREERLAGGGEAACDLVIDRGAWKVLVERSRHGVLRVTDDGERAERLVRNAGWLARSYPCPEVVPTDSPAPGAHAVRESFVDGVPIRDAPQEQWEPAYRELLTACTRHVAFADGAFDLDAAWRELEGWSLPGWLERAVATHRDGVERFLRNAPMLASHGDCHNGNVFVRPDGTPLLIDLERVQPMPFFYDALSLLRGSAPVNATLRRRYLMGAYDTELAALWDGAGRAWAPADRPAALLAMGLAHAFRPQFAQAESAKRRGKLVSACAKLRDDCGWG